MSSGNAEDADQKKRSQMIDRTLEEDSKKLKRECKILLLGTLRELYGIALLMGHRFWRERQEHDCEADEDHTSEWLHCGRIGALQAYYLQESRRLRKGLDWSYAAI